MNGSTVHESVQRRPSFRWAVLAFVLLALILGPFALFEERFNTLSTQLLAPDSPKSLAAAAIALLLASDVVLPIPSSVVSTASGALFGFWAGAFISWAGMSAGSLLALFIGRRLGRPGLRKIVGESELSRAEHLFSRYGEAALLVSRPVPVLAEATVLLSGACGMPASTLLSRCALSNAGISLVYAGAGVLAVDTVSFLFVFLGAIALPGFFMLLSRRNLQ